MIKGGDWVLSSSVQIALKYNIPAIVIGLTIVSFATSAPELMVSIISATKDSPEIALGNVVGSNVANLGLVLGVSLVFMTIKLDKDFFQKEILFLILSTLLYYIVIKFDMTISRLDGLLFVLILIFFIFYQIKRSKVVDDSSTSKNTSTSYSVIKVILLLLFGGLLMYFGSEMLISNAVKIAQKFNVSERVIAITIISIGTSLPELTASIISIVKKQYAVSVGNVIGSNIFNILAVLGITALIKPIEVTNTDFIGKDFYMMLFMVLLIPLFGIFPKRGFIGAKLGVLYLVLYFGSQLSET